DARRVLEIVHPEHRVAQLRDPRARKRMCGELLELCRDLGLAREIRLAAPRRFDAALQDTPVCELDLDAHRVAVLRSPGGARGTLPRLDLVRERDAGAVARRLLAELADEAVALDEQRRDAEREVHLRRGDPRGAVFPAGVIERDLRA